MVMDETRPNGDPSTSEIDWWRAARWGVIGSIPLCLAMLGAWIMVGPWHSGWGVLVFVPAFLIGFLTHWGEPQTTASREAERA